MASSPITLWIIDGETMETVRDYFLGLQKHCRVTAAMKNACSLEKSYDQPRQHIEKQRHYFAHKCVYSQIYGFSRSHVWMWNQIIRKLRAEKLMLLNYGVEEDS